MIQIKRATLADLAAAVRLFDAYLVFYGKSSNVEGAEAFLRQRLEAEDSWIYLAIEQQKAVGFMQLYPSFSSVRMARLWVLNDLFVDITSRGKGISIQLIDAAKLLVAETKACGLMLETAKSNDIGNSLYPRTGFVMEEAHNFYYWNA